MIEFIDQAKTVNSRLKLGAAILTKHDGRRKLCKITSNVISDYFHVVLAHTLPASVDVSKSQAEGKTVLQLDRESNCARELVEIAREIVEIAQLTHSAE
jgi:chromosome partitioning protein